MKRLMIYSAATTGFAFNRHDTVDEGEYITVTFRGHVKRFECVDSFSDDGEDIANCRSVSSWMKLPAKRKRERL